jgi:hypothetical protein
MLLIVHVNVTPVPTTYLAVPTFIEPQIRNQCTKATAQNTTQHSVKDHEHHHCNRDIAAHQ